MLLLGALACSGVPSRTVGTPGQPPPTADHDRDVETGDEEPLADGALGPHDDEAEPDTEEAIEESEPAPAPTPPPPHPLAGVSKAELEAMLLRDPASLGSISLGRPGRGALFNPVPMPRGTMWKIVNPRQTFGTQETIDALIRCIERVNLEHPGTQPVHVGDISEKNGGYITPHISHQSGRDVDVGYYYTTPHQWYVRGDASNLDLARNWTFVKAMITETDVQAIFIDRAIQRMLKDHALAAGEDPAWLDDVFGGGASTVRPLIMHEDGHDTHIHVRFYNPIAQETGRRVYRMLLAHNKIKPPTYYVHYKVKRGDNLGRIARKFKTSVKVLKKVNGLRSSRIYAGRSYRIPRRGGVKQGPKLILPARRLPPSAPTPATGVMASPER